MDQLTLQVHFEGVGGNHRTKVNFRRRFGIEFLFALEEGDVMPGGRGVSRARKDGQTSFSPGSVPERRGTISTQWAAWYK